MFKIVFRFQGSYIILLVSSKIINIMENRNSSQIESIRGSISEQTSNQSFSNYLVKNATLKYCVASKDLFKRYCYAATKTQNIKNRRQIIGERAGKKLSQNQQLQAYSNLTTNNQLQTEIYEFQSNQEIQSKQIKKQNLIIRQDPISDVYKPIKIINRYKCKQLLVLEKNNHKQKVLMKANKHLIRRGNQLINGEEQVQILNCLSHPCVVQLKQVFFNFDKYLILFEHFQGICLLEYLEKYTITQKIGKMIIKQVLQTLDYLHKLEIIHRDIRAEHIFLCFDNDKENFSIKIVDFSYAINKDKLKNHRSPASGLYCRNAPQILQGIINNKTDIWSVGVLALLLFLSFSPQQIESGDYIEDMLTKNENFQKHLKNIPEKTYDFINILMTAKHRRRPSANEALNHSWFKNPYGLRSQSRLKFTK